MLILVILYLLLIHQTLTSYTDFVNVADVITNYSKAGIPLETMWTDIDYMFIAQGRGKLTSQFGRSEQEASFGIGINSDAVFHELHGRPKHFFSTRDSIH